MGAKGPSLAATEGSKVMKQWIGRTALATLTLTLVQGIAGSLLFPREPLEPGTFQWSLFSNVVTVGAGVVLGPTFRSDDQSRARRPRLPSPVRDSREHLAETLFFDIGGAKAGASRLYSPSATWRLPALWRGGAAGGSADVTQSMARRPMAGWSMRIGLGALAYVVVYFTAGLTAFPFMADFYAGRPMPSPASIALIQVFRGIGYVGIALALVRWLPLHRMGTALMVGLTLSVIGGIAPLMVPNVYLPTPVRLVHLVEVGVSNFVFGFFVVCC